MIAIFDGHYLTYRMMHVKALAELSSNGYKTGVLLGSLRSLHGFLMSFPAIREVYVVFDRGHSARRLALFPGYKNKPPLTEEEQAEYEAASFQRSVLRCSILRRLGIRPVYLDGREGDDVIRLLRDIVRGKVIVVSDDKDLLQLVDDRTSVWRPMKPELVTEKDFSTRTGVPGPKYLIWYKAILGDPSDMIDGVKGAGAKTAARAVNEIRADHPEGFLTRCAKSEDRRIRLIAEQGDIFRRNVKLIDIALERFTPDEVYQARVQAGKSVGVDLSLLPILRRFELDEISDSFASWIGPFRILRGNWR